MPRKKKARPRSAAARAEPLEVQVQDRTLADRFDTYFTEFAHHTSRFAGSPWTFVGAVALIIFWAISGPLFGFSDTWQLVINTSTTIITFLMVFLIQSTQNRDALAVQVKLSELIIKSHGISNNFAQVEDLTEKELEELHEIIRKRANGKPSPPKTTRGKS
jgi:low affinity Fe/Cu permease